MDHPGYKSIEFPPNLKRFPPSSDHCKGPGLIQNLFKCIQEIFPKCFEGAHLKLRKKLSDAIWGGYNQTLSSVHPSNGQIAAELHNKNGDVRLALSPTGHCAFTTKVQINPAESFMMDAQIKPRRIFIGESSLIHSKNRTTAAFTVSASTLPFDIKDIDPEALTTWNVIDNMVTCLSVQLVRRMMNCWIVGGQWTMGDNIQIGICKKMHNGDIGIMVDKVKFEGFWWKRVAADFDVGLHVDCPWQDRDKSIMEVGGRWRYSGNQLRCFCTTEGLIGFDYRKRIFQTEEAHIAIKLSGLLNGHNDKFRLGFGIDVYV